MPPKQDPEERRKAILDAASLVFAQHGFDGATTDQIARTAGLSKGGLYWHFTSKEEILQALLRQFFDQELSGLEELLAMDGSALARLRLFVQQSSSALVAFQQRLPVMLSFYALASRDEQVRGFLQSYYQGYLQLLKQLFEQGYAQAEFQFADPASAAVSMIAQLEGLIVLWAIAPSLVELSQQAEASFELLVRGLQATGQD